MSILSKLRIRYSVVLLFAFLGYCSFDYYYSRVDLEFSGYCPQDGKTYTYREIADRAIAEIIRRGIEQNFPYKTPEELYAKNPDCCQFYSWLNPNEISLNEQRVGRYLLGRSQGGYIYQLSVRYRNKKYNEKPVNSFAYAIDACARILEISRPGDYSSPVRFIHGYP